MKSSGKLPEEAVVDEEAILSLLENSATFLSLSQTSNHSSLLGMTVCHLDPHTAPVCLLSVPLCSEVYFKGNVLKVVTAEKKKLWDNM